MLRQLTQMFIQEGMNLKIELPVAKNILPWYYTKK